MAKLDGTNGLIQQYDYQVLTTGFSYTFASGTQTLVANPAGTLATGTITMPAAPADGMVIWITTTQQIVALTINGNTGQTVVSKVTSLAPNQAVAYIYRASNTTWYPFETQMAQGNGPAFSAYNSSSTTLPSGTYTKVAFQTKTGANAFDTNGYFDNVTNYRFTPLIAGYYQINGGVSTNNPAGAVTAAVYKNGSVYLKGSIIVPQSGTTLAGSTVSGVIYFNGSTDYVEIYALQTNGSSQTTNANSYDTYFNGAMVRSA